MSSGYLLDSSILSRAVGTRRDPGVVRRMQAESSRCSTASVVLHEIRFGVERLPIGRRRAELESFVDEFVLATLPILPYDREAATWHAAERARQERLGRPAPFADSQIAAIARVNDLVVVTANLRDFQDRFEGLEVEDWTGANTS